MDNFSSNESSGCHTDESMANYSEPEDKPVTKRTTFKPRMP